MNDDARCIVQFPLKIATPAAGIACGGLLLSLHKRAAVLA
jgi:hypothetical protein